MPCTVILIALVPLLALPARLKDPLCPSGAAASRFSTLPNHRRSPQDQTRLPSKSSSMWVFSTAMNPFSLGTGQARTNSLRTEPSKATGKPRDWYADPATSRIAPSFFAKDQLSWDWRLHRLGLCHYASLVLFLAGTFSALHGLDTLGLPSPLLAPAPRHSWKRDRTA